MAPAILPTEGIGEVGVVKDIEEFGSELHVEAFPKAEILQRGKINVAEAEVLERVATHVAKRAEGRWQHDGILNLVAAKHT